MNQGQPTGELLLHVERRAGKDLATKQFHQGALRVLRPHYLDNTAQVCYTIVNPGGGYLGADRYRVDISVGASASLLLTTQSATKIYRTPQGRAQSQMHVSLAEGAVLEYIPDQLIAYQNASYRQETIVHMHRSSSLVMFEVITPGWSPEGDLFRYENIRLRTEVHVDGKLAVLDNLSVEPGRQDISSQLYFQEFTHVGMLLAVDSRIDTSMVESLRDIAYDVAAQQAEAVHVGISATAAAGLSVRTLGTSTESATAVLMSVVNELRERLHGQEPVQLRKY
ncbi:urease accessory protein UreD [Glutamicibacter sp. JC586]|uniref:urease accessory protein UreD n=1 Tax=Glutamicibacter sp. JC586 TaxID=2590552 RepID=UPI00135A61A3|nr:urease accessory protein UreD [Glutamicibacter sp. JC586]